MNNLLRVASLIEQLHEQDVREVIICAGSRNSPFIESFRTDDRFQVRGGIPRVSTVTNISPAKHCVH